MNKLILALAGLLAVQGARAQTVEQPAQPVRFLLGMGVSGGGDKLASGQYEDGSGVDIRTGGLFYFTAGIDYHIVPELSLQGTINYHVDDASAWNGDLKFERFPIELIGYYQPNPVFRVGGGVRYSLSPKLTSNGNAPEANASYDSKTAAVAEAEYFIEPTCGIKLRYVHETFKARGREIDGSHVGISANFYF